MFLINYLLMNTEQSFRWVNVAKNLIKVLTTQQLTHIYNYVVLEYVFYTM